MARAVNEFEIKKRGRRASEGETTRIRLSRTFTAMISEYGGQLMTQNSSETNTSVWDLWQ